MKNVYISSNDNIHIFLSIFRPFFESHTKATDELFYRRAVDFYYVNSSAFVFAVPFDAGNYSPFIFFITKFFKQFFAQI